jgi:hypothetical protein
MSTNLSRRAFASGASLAALAVVPTAAGTFPTLAEVNASPDFDLLVLGIQLEKVLARYVPVARKGRRRLAEIDRAVDKEIEDLTASGFTVPDDDLEETIELRTTIRSAVIDRDFHEPEEDGQLDDFWNAMHDELYPLCDEILEMRAKTLQGLAVQARAVSAAAHEMWEGYNEGASELQFLNRACEFLNVTPLHTECEA